MALMMDQGSTSRKASAPTTADYRKCKGLWQDKVIAFLYAINGILRVKKSEHDKPIIITHDEDLWQFNEQE